LHGNSLFFKALFLKAAFTNRTDLGTGSVHSKPTLATVRGLQLRTEGFEVRDEDVARLSPLAHEHINMLGRYAFMLPGPIARGELWPPCQATEEMALRRCPGLMSVPHSMKCEFPHFMES